MLALCAVSVAVLYRQAERQPFSVDESRWISTSRYFWTTFADRDLFGPGSLAEAPIAATLPDGRVIAGAVDRLLVEESRVRLVDFKTGRQVPESADSLPRSHRLQMEAYRDALRVIFPGRPVEAALLYTAGPKIIDLPG